MTRHTAAMTGCFFSALALFPSLVWIARDKRVWMWDQAWYGEVTAQLYGTLITQPSRWFAELLAQMPSKPPLTAWLGQLFMPLGLMIGDVDFALLLSIVLTQALTLYVLFHLTRIVAPSSLIWPIVAVLLTGSAPLFVGLSHEYLVEPLQACVVVASFLLAAACRRLPFTRVVALLALLVIAGMGAKLTTPLYCSFAWLLTGLVLLRRLMNGERPEFPDRWSWPAILSIAALLLTVGSWYWANYPTVLGHLANATSNELALQYGRVGTLTSKLVYWLESFAAATFIYPPLAIAAAVIMLPGIIRFLAGRNLAELDRSARWSAIVVAACVLQIALVIGVLSLQIGEETRFLLPAIPLFAVVVAFALSISRLVLVPRMIALVLLGTLIAVNAQALGRVDTLNWTAWLRTIQPQNHNRDVIQEIAARTCPLDRQYKYTIVAVERPEMNANTMAMYSARHLAEDPWRCYYTSLGYAETNAARALQRIFDIDAAYVVLPKAENLSTTPDFLNAVTAPIQKIVASDVRFVRDGAPVGDYEIWRVVD